MTIDNTHEPHENDWTTLLSSLRKINQEAVGVIVTDTLPTAATVPAGKMVIYDDGAGTKRAYFRTGQGNIGYVGLT